MSESIEIKQATIKATGYFSLKNKERVIELKVGQSREFKNVHKMFYGCVAVVNGKV